MFLRRLRRLRRTTTFRLTVYYAVTFGVCLVAALLLIDRGMWVLLAKSDNGFLHAQLKELMTEYREGLDALRRDVSGKHSTIAAVRVASADNHTIALFRSGLVLPGSNGATFTKHAADLGASPFERWGCHGRDQRRSCSTATTFKLRAVIVIAAW